MLSDLVTAYADIRPSGVASAHIWRHAEGLDKIDASSTETQDMMWIVPLGPTCRTRATRVVGWNNGVQAASSF